MQISHISPEYRDGHMERQDQAGWIGGQLGILAGLALMAAVAFCFASLATWSVDDPSLSNANSNIPQNAGGFIGSTIADLLMQFTGLASVVFLVVPAGWAWLKIARRPIHRMKSRAIAWLPSTVLAAAALGCFGRPETWPLPTGLGGVAGDLVLKLPATLIGQYPSGLLAVPFIVVFTIASLFLTLFAAGLIVRSSNSGDLIYDPETGEILDDDEDEAGVALGALAHWFYLLRAQFRRKPSAARTAPRSRSTAAKAHDRPGLLVRARKFWNELVSPPDDGLEAFDPRSRREPGFGAGAPVPPEPRIDLDEDDREEDEGDYLRAPEMAPSYGEEIHGGEEADEADDWQPRSRPAATPAPMPARPALVQPMKQKLQPGSRVSREAQASFIGSEAFELPSLHLLAEAKAQGRDASLSTEALEQNARLLEGVLEDFGVRGEIINVRPGPVVTMYELEPAPGIKSSRVIGLADDIARSMSAIACRVAVVPGRNAIGIELPNVRRETVYLRELLASKDYEGAKGRLALILGKTIGGEPVIADLAKMPHLLVAGTTGSGKSVAINTMILSILYRLTPEQVRLIMIDPKMLELSIYDGIPHLLTPVVTDPKKAVVALKWTVREMEERYKKMSKLGVRNIEGYNARLEQAKKKNELITRTVQTGYDRDTGEAIYQTEELDLSPMPFIVVIIDEMADLMMVAGKDIEGAVQRLAQMARAAGIHVVMATQRPSVDVITGTIKANFPTRISFQVTSKIDSRTILGEQGAEQLLGMGDMLYMAGGGRIQRVHGPFVADDEVESVVAHLKTQGAPEYLESVTEEDEEDDEGYASGPAGTLELSESNDLYDQAVAVVLNDRKVSTSYIQRRLGIGYNRAASLIERMEKEGLIGKANHAGKREILVPGENETI
ncbi:MAG: DNA translocase FtsK [Nitratireductor sp.]|nr:DNA translocase FtsK [Nitratireductor sp.]